MVFTTASGGGHASADGQTVPYVDGGDGEDELDCLGLSELVDRRVPDVLIHATVESGDCIGEAESCTLAVR